VFKDIPLEKFGNRIPQQSVEAVRTKTNAFPVESVAYTGGINGMQFTPDFRRLYLLSSGTVQVYDVPTRSRLLSFALPNDGFLALSPTTAYSTHGFPVTTVYSSGYDGGFAAIAATDGSSNFIDLPYWAHGNLFFRPFGAISPGSYQLVSMAITGTARSFIPTFYFEDMDGGAWAVGKGAANEVWFLDFATNTEHVVTTTTSGDAYAMMNEDGNFVVFQGSHLFIVDPGAWTAAAATSSPLGTSDIEMIFRSVLPGAASIWIHNAEYNAADASLIRTVNTGDWGSYTGGLLYDPINHALIHPGATTLDWLYLDRIANAGVTLQTIATDVGELCGMTAFDTSAARRSWSRAGRSPRAAGATCSSRCSRSTIATWRRTTSASASSCAAESATGATIATEWMVRQGTGDRRYAITIAQDQDLPQRLTVNFSDVGRDQQASNVVSMRSGDTTDSKRERSIDMTTYVSTRPRCRSLPTAICGGSGTSARR
jgi:hypothetical protein